VARMAAVLVLSLPLLGGESIAAETSAAQGDSLSCSTAAGQSALSPGVTLTSVRRIAAGALAKGYAVVSTASGHDGMNANFAEHQLAKLNEAYCQIKSRPLQLTRPYALILFHTTSPYPCHTERGVVLRPKLAGAS
jgi:hypothetical protein